METRKNTLKILFVTSVKVPTYLEVLRFMATGVKIPATDVHSVYKDENDQKFYVKFIDENSYNRFCNSVDDQYWFHYTDGERTPVQLELASRQFKYIRIFNLPPETEEKEIVAALGKYGKIRQHVRERYPQDLGYHVFSGIRGVYMEVEKEIPANMYIAHFRVRVYYEGLKNKCFFCKAEGHIKADCPKLASLRNNAETGGQRSYSSVAANLKIATSNEGETEHPPLQKTTLPLPATRSQTIAKTQNTSNSITPSTSTVTTLTPASVTTIADQKPKPSQQEMGTKVPQTNEAERNEEKRRDQNEMTNDEDIQSTESESEMEAGNEDWKLQQRGKRPIAETPSVGSTDSNAGQGKGQKKLRKRGSRKN